MSKEIAEIAFDLHAGGSAMVIPEYDDLQKIGMAATLAVHIKGLGDIPYEVLRKVSDHYFSIPSYALEPVLRILSEVNFVRLTERGRKIDIVTPNIPLFDDIYNTLGDFTSSEFDLNSYEQATLQILSALQKAPVNKDTLYTNLGIEKPVFDRCVDLSGSCGILSLHEARGRKMLISPHYFADNLDALADAAVAAGASTVAGVLGKVKENQGWPLSLALSQGEIGGTRLSTTEQDLLRKLSEEGVIKPPTIKFGSTAQSFVFTPKPGAARLNAANREVYERAMALISTVRKGQLLPKKYAIRSPKAILSALRDNGYLKSNSDAYEQYHNLVVMRVASLKEVRPGRWQLHLNDTDENKAALNLAIKMLQTGSMSGMEIDTNARIAMTKNEQYIQSLISSKDLKQRQQQKRDEQADHEFDQLLLKLE